MLTCLCPCRYGVNKASENRHAKTPKQPKSISHQVLPWHDHRDSWRARHIIMGKQGSTGTFHAHHFKDVMDRLLKTSILG